MAAVVRLVCLFFPEMRLGVIEVIKLLVFFSLGSQCSYGFVLLFELVYHNMLLEISVLSSLWQWSCEWNVESIIG